MDDLFHFGLADDTISIAKNKCITRHKGQLAAVLYDYISIIIVHINIRVYVIKT